MIIIDDVYQKVLTLANKEQRGYITPQEFNILADKAQMEIYESYFHDLKTAYHKPKSQVIYSDESQMLSEKLQYFKVIDDQATFEILPTTNVLELGSLLPAIYRLDTISISSATLTFGITSGSEEDGDAVYGTIIEGGGPMVEMMEMDRSQITYSENNPLTKATWARPVFVREGSTQIRIYPIPELDVATVTVHYWRRPTKPNWNYVIVDQKALYNFNNSVNFELHPSEEEKLVGRILELSGVIIKDLALAQLASADKINTTNSQND
mgnify:CR=1 FL=1|tara:strand:+ start:1071 stop:1871 length:801 start_codon:yes stop_codon:yes gene_type:complete